MCAKPRESQKSLRNEKEIITGETCRTCLEFERCAPTNGGRIGRRSGCTHYNASTERVCTVKERASQFSRKRASC